MREPPRAASQLEEHTAGALDRVAADRAAVCTEGPVRAASTPTADPAASTVGRARGARPTPLAVGDRPGRAVRDRPPPADPQAPATDPPAPAASTAAPAVAGRPPPPLPTASSSSGRRRLDQLDPVLEHHLAIEGAVHRTLGGDRLQPAHLLFAAAARQAHVEPELGRASAFGRRVLDAHVDRPDVPALALRVHLDRDRRA